MRFIIATLGCKVNQYESEALELMLRQNGHTPCTDGEAADIIVVNSCAVTAEGTRKVRQTIRRLQGKHPDALLALCGCWSQVEPEKASDFHADVLFGTGHRAEFVSAIEKALSNREKQIRLLDNPFQREAFEQLPSGAYAGHTRAYLKIEDGCDNFCTYCIIPFARGRVLSLPAEQCAEEALRLAGRGYKEIVVTGIEISSWGKDLKNGRTLIDALEAIASAVPDVRLHLGSLEPTILTEDFIVRAQKLNLCRHFHLSMQSGCDETLSRMRRKYTTAFFLQVVQSLRRAFPGCSITTDLITGFPGETDAEFASTLDFIRQCLFSDMHIFPYSVRQGTRAAEFPGQVSKQQKDERAHVAQQIAALMKKEYLAECVGQKLPVLFESEKGGFSAGHADNYTEVSVAVSGLRGDLKNVLITSSDADGLQGRLV